MTCPADLQSNFDTLWMDDDEDLREISGEIEYVGPLGEEVVISYEATLSIPQILSEKVYPNMSQSSYEFGVNFKGETLRGKDSVVTTNTSWKPSKGKKNMEHRFTPSRAFMDYAKVTKEAPFAGAGSLFKFGGNDSALGGFTAKELTESSSIHGDFDHASLNYSGKQNIEARAESANPTGGATGDQIVSWEHNGLSSPSGPPSDIFWSEELDAEGYGDVQKYVSIDFTWDYSGEHEDAVSDGDYYITDQIKDLVESEVESGEYSGSGWYSYTVEIEDDKGEITEEDVDIDYSWG